MFLDEHLTIHAIHFVGPYKVNRVPVRRVHQHFVIATSTRLNIEKVEVPANIDDAYFRRIRQKRPKKAEGDIFAKKKKVTECKSHVPPVFYWLIICIT